MRVGAGDVEGEVTVVYESIADGEGQLEMNSNSKQYKLSFVASLLYKRPLPTQFCCSKN